jgi:hypothetical protein
MAIVCTTHAATGITTRRATLNGEVTGLTDPVDYYFEYGPDAGYGSTTAAVEIAADGTFDVELTELDHDTAVHFRAVIDDGVDTHEGDDEDFETEALTCTAAAADDITSRSATLNGSFTGVTGISEVFEVYFEYGEDVGYGETTPAQVVTEDDDFDAAIDLLTHDTEHHFRAVLTDGYNVVNGADDDFETELLAVTTDAESNLTTHSVKFNGSIADLSGNASINVWFQWGWSTSYGFTTATQTISAVPDDFEAQISGLPQGSFHYRAAATDGHNTVYGANEAFAITPFVAMPGDVDVVWLFYINAVTARYWSTTNFTFDPLGPAEQEYTAMIDPASFDGIKINKSYNGADRVHFIEDFTIYVPNPSNSTLSPDHFYDFTNKRGRDATVSIYRDDGTNSGIIRVFKLKTKTVLNTYQGLEITFEDAMVAKLEATYPNTKDVVDLYNSKGDSAIGYSLPIPFGVPYIPLPNVLVSGSPDKTYYVLGEIESTYTIMECKSPEGWAKSTWHSDDFAFEQSSGTGNRRFQALIADDGAGGLTQGVFVTGRRLPIRTQYSRADTVAKTSPATIVKDLLCSDFTVDTDSYWISVAMNGAFAVKKPRYEYLSSILKQSGAALYIGLDGDREARTLVKGSVFTVNASTVKQKDFHFQRVVDPHPFDGAYFAIPENNGPQDVLYKYVVGFTAAAEPANPADEVLEMPYVYSSTVAKRLAILWAQRRFEQGARVKFTGRVNMLACNPDDVVKIDGRDYGSYGGGGLDYYYGVLQSVHIHRNLSVTCDAIWFNHDLSDFYDLAPSAPTAAGESTTITQLQPVVVGPDMYDADGNNPNTSALVQKYDIRPDITDASYTFALGDEGAKCNVFNRGTAQTATVPPNTDVAFPVGCVIPIYQHGAGLVTIAKGSGVDVVNRSSHTGSAGQYAFFGLFQKAADYWILFGDTA